MKNVQWIIKSPLYLHLKKHYCPKCFNLLNVVKTSKIVTGGSAEAKRMGLDYSMVGGVYQSDKIKVVWKEFECSHCNLRITVEEMKKLEGYPQ